MKARTGVVTLALDLTVTWSVIKGARLGIPALDKIPDFTLISRRVLSSEEVVEALSLIPQAREHDAMWQDYADSIRAFCFGALPAPIGWDE